MTTKRKPKRHEDDDDLRPEYDFKSLGPPVRGKYYERARAGTNLVLLEPDVAAAFPTQDSVNRALRLLSEVATATVEPHRRRSGHGGSQKKRASG
jgi:hypothetical protein